MKKAYTFRFEPRDVESWKSCAVKSELTLSEWVRRRCNGEGNLILGERKAVRAGVAPEQEYKPKEREYADFDD